MHPAGFFRCGHSLNAMHPLSCFSLSKTPSPDNSITTSLYPPKSFLIRQNGTVQPSFEANLEYIFAKSAAKIDASFRQHRREFQELLFLVIGSS